MMRSVVFDCGLFKPDSIKRAAYRFADRATFEFRLDGSYLTVTITVDGTEEQLSAVVDDLHREVLDQDLRDTLSQETAQIRTLILASAFSKTQLIG